MPARSYGLTSSGGCSASELVLPGSACCSSKCVGSADLDSRVVQPRGVVCGALDLPTTGILPHDCPEDRQLVVSFCIGGLKSTLKFTMDVSSSGPVAHWYVAVGH
ncbi:hypothetical protein NDU88_005435 [Pleurodeles waltl]|uniref:Uncharacterized protein n=1 Tax=Pleurodeles waltl TaxID=8319 RepID=A0AAV7PII9_PLEWA|nr:hypothetical protein NDU88_005435 [Pleurodeles waltl]